MATEFIINPNTKLPEIEKDPNAVLDYTFDWTDWLAGVGDSIVSATPAIDDPVGGGGATIVRHEVVTASKVVVWVSGGDASARLRLRCRIVTDSAPTARQDDKSVILKVKHR